MLGVGGFSTCSKKNWMEKSYWSHWKLYRYIVAINFISCGWGGTTLTKRMVCLLSWPGWWLIAEPNCSKTLPPPKTKGSSNPNQKTDVQGHEIQWSKQQRLFCTLNDFERSSWLKQIGIPRSVPSSQGRPQTERQKSHGVHADCIQLRQLPCINPMIYLNHPLRANLGPADAIPSCKGP